MPGTQGAASVSGERPLASIVPEEWRALRHAEAAARREGAEEISRGVHGVRRALGAISLRLCVSVPLC